jgi:tyrosyl-tRNA synthetase
VGINEPPADMYGKLMSVSDALMFRYFDLATRVPEAELAELRTLHPMEAKKRLARTVTAMYHGEAGAAAAEAHFARVVQGREVPENVEEIRIPTPAAQEPLWKLLAKAGLVASTSEGRRMIQQGAVELDGNPIVSLDYNVTSSGESHLVKVGKRRFKRFVLEKE